MLLLLNLPLLVFLLTPRLFGFPPRRKVPLRDLDQVVDVLIEGRAQRVQPIQAAEAQPQGAGRANVLDPERYDDRAGVERRHDLVEDIGRGIRRPREDHDEEFCLPDRLDDRRAPVSEADIARRYPAADARFLQPVADGIGGSLIGDGVADEDVVGHAAASFGPERSRQKVSNVKIPQKPRPFALCLAAFLARRAYRAAMNGKLS